MKRAFSLYPESEFESEIKAQLRSEDLAKWIAIDTEFQIEAVRMAAPDDPTDIIKHPPSEDRFLHF